jgi:type III secretion protein L
MPAGKIIKRAALKDAPPLRGVVKRPVIDALAEARRLVAEAKAEAASIRASAEASARGLREAAYREGYEDGLLELNEHLLAARDTRAEALVGVEQEVLRLSVKIAAKIIGRELKRDDATLADIVASALRNVQPQEMLVVRINPADAPLVQEHRERLDPTARALRLDLVPDPRVARGGCVIESPSGTVDAQLDTQLRSLERALLARASGGEERREQPRQKRPRKRAAPKRETT